jgi:hypothetical protein
MTNAKCPPFGTGSVDFNAVNEAAEKGKDLVEAIAKATTTKDAPAASPPAPPAAEKKSAASPATL